MKRKLFRAIVILTMLLAFAACLGGCKKKQAVPDPAETQEPVVLEHDGEIEIEVPEGQDTFGE